MSFSSAPKALFADPSTETEEASQLIPCLTPGAQAFRIFSSKRMKKVTYSLMALAILAISSCAITLEEDIPEATQTLIAKIDNGDTKTSYLEEGGTATMSWISGDQIKLVVYNNESKAVGHYTCTASESGTTANFTLGDDLNTHTRSGYAIYPTLTLGGTEDDGYTVDLPASYTIPNGTDLTKVQVPMIGVVDPSDDKQYTFSVAVGVLKVQLVNVPVSARKLVLKTASDKLAGTFPLDNVNGFRMADAADGATNTITVNFGQQAAGASIAVYMPVPVGTISAGATFEVQDSGGTPIMETAATTKAITITKGRLLPVKPFAVEDWQSLGIGRFVDNHAFYQAAGFCNADGLTADTYLNVEIQRHATETNRYRLVNPYGALFEDPYNATHFGTGPNEYLTFTIDPSWGTDVVKNDSFRIGIKQYGGYYGDYELWHDNPGWGYTSIYQNNRVIKKDGSGNPLNIQLAPFYMGYLDEDCSTNPKIEIVFPDSEPMLVFNYNGQGSASYSSGNVTASLSGYVTGIKVAAAATFQQGVENIVTESGTILNFTESGTKPIALDDGTYVLVYKLETDNHGCIFKNGGTFSVYSKVEIPLDESMITVNVEAGYLDGSYIYDGGGKAALVDGDVGTFWHSPYWNKFEGWYGYEDLDPTYGAFIDIDLGEGYSVDSFDVRACLRSGAASDFPKHVIVYSKPDGGSWNKVGEVDNVCSGVAAGQWINPIECTGDAARFIRFSIVSNTSDQDLRDPAAGGCTHLAEIKLYGTVSHNGVPVDPWLNLFTDSSYSELKAGITSTEITAMNGIAPYYLAENVALPLLNSTYQDKEFRIGSYAPYSDIRMDPPVFMTRLYSAMDNPTGIEVKSGEEITVCVDRIPDGQTVSLAIYGDAGTNPNFGGTADWTYGYTGSWQEGYDQNIILTAGINTINITADGMAYVMNTVTQADPYNPSKTSLASYQPVKVHFLPGSGKVQGYFEPATQENAFGQSYIDACTYKYFMIKGEKASFLFHTDEVQNYTAAEIRSGIEAMDSAVEWEQELCGIDNLSWFNNHILFCSQTSGTYMDASHRRIMLSTDNISKIISLDGIMSAEGEGGWGPFHEMGHIHQHPINWKSTSESSNNLFSNYCKKMLADQEGATFYSRGKPLSILAQNLAAKTPWVLLGLTPSGDDSYQNEDTEIHMRMNWQLWNYYHNCGYNTHFFPDLFTYLRKTENMLYSEYSSWYYWNLGFDDNPGKAQLQYYEACCEVAQEDLTEFFEVWGFFRPVDVQFSQYGNAQYTVTQSMIDDAKARVAAKGYPKAAPIQYLEDRAVAPYGDNDSYTYSQLGLWTQFRDNPVITGTPTAVMAGNLALLSGVDNAVGIEYRKGDNSNGELLNFSNMQYIEIPAVAGTLWAVQSDGTRVQIM